MKYLQISTHQYISRKSVPRKPSPPPPKSADRPTPLEIGPPVEISTPSPLRKSAPPPPRKQCPPEKCPPSVCDIIIIIIIIIIIRIYKYYNMITTILASSVSYHQAVMPFFVKCSCCYHTIFVKHYEDFWINQI